MTDSPIEIREYLTTDEHNPFRAWLLDLRDAQTRARIRVRLNRVRLGNLGDFRSVGAGVHELRLQFGAGYRIYFGRSGSALVILLCGGDKSSQKRDIERAQSYWVDYLQRQR